MHSRALISTIGRRRAGRPLLENDTRVLKMTLRHAHGVCRAPDAQTKQLMLGEDVAVQGHAATLEMADRPAVRFF